MRTITIKQPYASLIVDGIKDIENRSWNTKFRGRILIHAATKPDKIDFSIPGQATVKEITMSTALNNAEENELFGCIIGSVEIIDCVEHHISEWAIPFQKHWVLANPIKLLEPIPAKGRLSFWDFESEDFEECTSCDKKFPMEIMEDDSAGNWFCPECWKELAPVMAEEYKNYSE